MTGASVDRADLVAAAKDLARRIWEHRVYTKDGSVTWRPLPTPHGPATVDPFLYDGTAGIALFLAALGKVTEEDDHRQQSLQAIAPVRKKLATLVADPERAAKLKGLGIGGFVGLGSLIYSFLRIGQLLDDAELIQQSRDVVRLITAERIESDPIRDVLLGSAGALLALTTLHRELAAGDAETLLDTGHRCARRLLSDRSPFTAAGPRAWRTLPGFPPLGGFSHGAAGICTALLRFYQITGDADLLKVAREGLAFERSLYSPEHKNWRDMRSPNELRFETTWCYGAPGIALGRLGTLHILDDQQIREDIAHGIETTRSKPLTDLDHLCCGNLGRAEILLYAHLKLGGRELRDSAEKLARSVLQRAEARAYLSWRFDMTPEAFDPSLFTGASGVGYTLLRLVYPTALPCILLLE